MDESDEKQCNLVIPSIGYDKSRTPPPMPGDNYLYVNYSYNIEHILYIDEEQNVITITFNVQKEWYDTSLTFQNLKKDKDNLIFQEDKNMIWIPWVTDKNIRNLDKKKRADEEEIFKVVPNDDFEFQHSSNTSYQTALLFKEHKTFIHISIFKFKFFTRIT